MSQPWQTKLSSDVALAVVDEMEKSGNPYIAEKLKAHSVSIPLAYAEISEGARLLYPFCVAIGRKPA